MISKHHATGKKKEKATAGLPGLEHKTSDAKLSLQDEMRAELIQANHILHDIIETMPVGAIIADADGMILLTNTAGREILGSPMRGSIGSPDWPYTTHYPDGAPFPPEEMPLMHALKEGHPVYDVEMLIRRADEQERFILVNAAPIRDEKGRVVSAVSVFEDITERKQSRMALKQTVERLTVLRKAAQVILSAGSLEELAESILPYMRKLVDCQISSVLVFDWKTDEAILLSASNNRGISIEKGTRISLEKGWLLGELAQGEISTIEDLSALELPPAMRNALQNERVRALVNFPLVAQGKLLGVLALGFRTPIERDVETTDILRQMADKLAIGIRQLQQHEELERHAKQLERTVTRRTGALKESEERFRIILEAAVFGIALIDTEGRIVQSNPALQTMLGYSEDELKSMSFSDYSHPDDAEVDRELYQALASVDTGHYQVQKRYIRKDGQVRWSELSVSRVKRSEKGYPWLAVAVMEDITEKKKIQKSLVRADRQDIAGRLGASLAHEINNPLQAVVGCLGLAKEILEEGSEAQRYLDIAMEELVRASGLVSQLRDLGHEPEMKDKELADVNGLVEKALVLTRKRCQNQSVEVEWSPAEDLPPVPLAPERIQQVLLNLVLNAVEAMDDGGRLRLHTAPTSQPAGVLVSISDNGPGIEAKNLDSIFEPFYSSRPDGLGLGLYISKKIVNEHCGTIEVDSRPGEGATFTVWLPR